jgi:ParB/RepB/Spo0J family partition protein
MKKKTKVEKQVKGKQGGVASGTAKVAPDKVAPLIAKPPKSVGLVETARLMPNPWNGNRKADEGLLQSVRAKGVLQNLVAREIKGGKLEVICGGRRLDAAQRTQTKLVPVAIYELSDREAREIHIIENLQRENKTPIEEAKEVGELLAMGKSSKEVSAQLGRPWTWVVQRAALGDLAPEIFKALDNPKHGIHHGSYASLELLSKYPHDVQRTLLAGEGKQQWFWEDGDRLKRQLANLTKELKLAPWAADDALLHPAAGPCNTCPKRSSYSPGLFDDTDEAAELAAHDRCLDGACWAVKLAAYLKRAEDKARQEHPGLVKVVTEDLQWSDPLREDKTVLGVHAFEKVKPDAKGAKPALVMQGPGAGKVIHVVPHRESSGSAYGGRDKSKPKTMAEKREGLESRRIALIIVEKLKPELAKSKLPKPGGDPLEALKDQWWLRLVAAWGAQEPQDMMEVEEEREGGWADFDKTEKDDDHCVREQVWEQLKKPLEDSLGFALPTQLGEECMANAKRLAWLLGLKWVELLEFAVAQIPEPKSWAKEAQAKDAKK